MVRWASAAENGLADRGEHDAQILDRNLARRGAALAERGGIRRSLKVVVRADQRNAVLAGGCAEPAEVLAVICGFVVDQVDEAARANIEVELHGLGFGQLDLLPAFHRRAA